MRVGDILLERGWVDPRRLERAIAEQARAGVRLCSMLVGRGAVAFDHAARALGEQHEVAAALQRHLQHRDHGLASLLPGVVARATVALPIGRLGDGRLIVCVRDPSPSLHDSLARVIGEEVVVAVTPARRIEQLVGQAYRPPAPPRVPPARRRRRSELELDIEVDLGTDGSVDVDVDVDVGADVDEPFELDISVEAPRPAPARTSPRPAVTALPVAFGPSRPVVAAPTGPARGTLEGTIALLADVDELEWLLDVVMGYVARRWSASLLLAIGDGIAVGRRGHGAQLTEHGIRAVSLPLAAPSIVQLARDRRRVVGEVPVEAGEVQDQLAAALGEPHHPVASVITRGDEVAYVLVVGDPEHDDPDDAAVDLARLAEAVDEAVARLG